MAQCGTCVGRLYKSVIDEVIAGVKESFLDEGIDDQVLTDLKLQWEAKLNSTKAAEHSEITQLHQKSQQENATSSKQQSTQPQPASTVQAIQITVPPQHAGGVAKNITIHAPFSALASGIAGPQLENILSSPEAAQTFALETSQAAEIIQRQLNAALQRNGVILPNHLLQYSSSLTTQVDGPSDVPLHSEDHLNIPGPSRCSLANPSLHEKCFRNQTKPLERVKVKVDASVDTLDAILNQGLAASQIDGTHGMGDSSDEISDDDDDDEDEDEKDDDKNDVDGEEEDAEDDTVYEDPLNSEDDVSDDGTTEDFDAENVVVCQYDKITRVRNKWKLHLKDGIMNLKSKDYVFSKAHGEGEW